jgi:hypothetical protein
MKRKWSLLKEELAVINRRHRGISTAKNILQSLKISRWMSNRIFMTKK